MTAKEFKRSNHYRCTFAYVFGGQTCVSCRKHRVTFAIVRFDDSRVTDQCRIETQIRCHACSFRGFRTDSAFVCDSFEEVHDG